MSQQPITIEDIYAIFSRSREEFQEELRISRLEYDRRAAEADKRSAEADKRAAELDKSLDKLRKSVAETTRAVNGLTSRWGRFVEELVEPAVVRLFQDRGIDVKEKHPRVSVKRQNVAMEIDILVVDTTDVVLVECKSRLSKDDVDEFLEKLEKFKLAFPAYKNYQAYGAVAGIEINEGVDRYAYQKGLFVIRPSGDTVEIVNDQKFKPITW
ncbi:DUF3782 domain-containing protein [Pseudanabaena sp. FACHB-1998]|uniref:DUF3782 domain-containing protein n=1 Tax=Pseudanabaena sp. FACHB-1998 TaxID=2692858 RepID=UPI001681B5D2|nr:DUF3782 domain-containing protein [Pseudanabaena sp. FACHB-1998]MBD2175900.1 DUF3782 domain-containing protein [Pseudanabaena sp. FACHB-1998]